MFRKFLRNLSEKSITLSRTDVMLIGGAAGLVALIHFGGNGVYYTTADDMMPAAPPPKPTASTCLKNVGDEFTNRCNENIKIINCLPMPDDTRICTQLSLKPSESFIAVAGIKPAEVGACYMYQVPFTRIDREGFICR